MAHVSKPMQTALLSVLSLQQYPSCFAPIGRAGQSDKGWSYVVADAIQNQAYSAYKFWNNLLAGLVALISAFFTISKIRKLSKE